jgi:hypothetical protein
MTACPSSPCRAVGATSPTGDPAKRKINLSVAPKGSVMSDVGSARCPVCGTPTTQTQQAIIEERLREIQDGARTEEQAKLCAQHEAELKKATAEAAAKARQEVVQKLAQALIKEMRQADRIRQLETNQATLQAEATKAQQQLQAQFEKDLKAATEKAAVDARRDVEQTLAQAHIKETEQADRIHQLETNETALRAEAAKAQQHLQAKFEKDLSAATETAANDARRDVEQKLADAQLKEKQQAERISKLEADAATQRANASRAQEQSANDLKVAVEKATRDARAAVVNELNAKDAELRASNESHAEELKQQRETLDEHHAHEQQKLRNEFVENSNRRRRTNSARARRSICTRRSKRRSPATPSTALRKGSPAPT